MDMAAMGLTWQGDLLLEALVKLGIAAVLGGLIGFEREAHGQFAGFRTILLITVASCLMMMLSLHLPEIFANKDAASALRIDPGRIASYAVAGMGFLGGGAIIKGRGSVRGLTTAASLWLVTGIGLAVGAGFVIPAAACTGFSLIFLYYFGYFKGVLPHREYTILSVRCSCAPGMLKRLKAILKAQPGVTILFVNFHYDAREGVSMYRFRLATSGRPPWGRMVGELMDIEGLLDLSWSESDVP